MVTFTDMEPSELVDRSMFAPEEFVAVEGDGTVAVDTGVAIAVGMVGGALGARKERGGALGAGSPPRTISGSSLGVTVMMLIRVAG